MNNVKQRSRRYLFVGIILFVAGILFTTLMKEQTGIIGIVFIVIGAVFVITGISIRRTIS